MIDAYSCEGWNGQSQENIMPEKDLQKDASKILQCKLAIHEAFHKLIYFCFCRGVSKNPYSIMKGRSTTKDIFCTKYGAKYLVNNDIILCDCGTHQNV